MAAKKYGLSALNALRGDLRVDVGDPSALTAWAADTAYAVGDYRRPSTPNGWAYKCIKISGDNKSHATTEPTWPTTKDETVADDAIVWQAYSKGVVALLVESAYTPNQDTHNDLADITNECADASYARKYCSTSGGLTSIGAYGTTGGYATSTNVTTLDFADVVWTTLTEEFDTVVFAVDYGTDATSPLIAYDEIGSQAPSGVNFTYKVNASGIVSITTA